MAHELVWPGFVMAGVEAPEGVVTGRPGSLYLQTAGSGGLLFVKLTGSGTTGWRVGLTANLDGSFTVSGTITASDFVVSTGALRFTPAAAKIVPGATSLSLRNTADSADNVLVSDAGAVTVRTRIASAADYLGTGTSLTINAAVGNLFTCIPSGNVTFNAPTNPIAGQRIVVVVIQDGTGGRTATWNSIFHHAWSDTGNTAGKRSSIAFTYDGALWMQDGAQTPYVS